MEYSASEMRRILQGLFPKRRLVLSQFTFFNQIGVVRATGTSYRRGRRCYRLEDILSIACILTLKEEGIPYRNVENVPAMIQQSADRIFAAGPGCRLSGFGSNISLHFPWEANGQAPLQSFLDEGQDLSLFWGLDVGMLALQLRAVASELLTQDIQRAA